MERILFACRDAGDPHARDALAERFLPLARRYEHFGVGEHLGVGQIQISRLLHQTLTHLRHVADQQHRLASGQLRPDPHARQPDRVRALSSGAELIGAGRPR